MANILYLEGVINPEIEFQFELRPKMSHELSLRWIVPESLNYLKGHFPNYPIVPGVALIDASVQALQVASKTTQVQLSGVKNAKFLRPVVPGDKINIALKKLDESGLEWKALWSVETSVLVAEIAFSVCARS